MAIALNILVILLEAWTFRLVAGRKWQNLVFYTFLSNLCAMLSSLLLLVFGQPPWVTAMRYLAVCMMTMTALVTAGILVPMGGDPKKLLWSGNGLFHHVICPILTFVSYVFFENHAGLSLIWLPVSVTLLYGLIMLYLNGRGIVDGPYPFFRVRHQPPRATVVWIGALLLLIGGISALIALV